MVNFDEILLELSYRVEGGIVDLTKSAQVSELVNILRENGVSDANEYAQRARVVFGFVNEASKKKPAVKSKKVNPNDVLTQKVNNPDTGNDVMVGSALGYDKNKAVYKAAVARLKKAGASDDEIANIASKANQNIRGKTEPSKGKKPKPGSITVSSAEKRAAEKEEPIQRDDKEKVNRTFESIYGGNKPVKPGMVMGSNDSGDNEVKNELLKYGFDDYQNKTGKKPAPGSKGSAFNEIISGEGVKILNASPDLSDIELTRVIMKQFCGSKLGKSQSESKNVVKHLPEDLKKNPCAHKAYIAARSARGKFDRMDKTRKELQSKGLLSKTTEVHTFYGSDNKDKAGNMDPKSSKSAQIEMAKNAKKIMTPLGEEVRRDDAIAFIALGGGGPNPSDTSVFLTDNKGNLVIKFYSDKTSPADIQDNSTLAKEISEKSTQIDDMEKSGVLSKNQAKKARKILARYAASIFQIEETYSEGTKLVAENLKKGGNGYSDAEQVNMLFGSSNKEWQKKNNIVKNFQEAVMDKKGVKKEIIENLPKGCNAKKPDQKCLYFALRSVVAKGGASNTQQKVLMKLSAGLIKKISDKGKEVPAEIDVNSIVSVQRKKVADSYTNMFGAQNEIKIKIGNTTKGLGTVLQSEDVIESFHLGLMDYPPKKYKKGDPTSLMGSCFEASMGGSMVNGEILRQCLGVKNTQEFKERFEAEETREYTYEFTEAEAIERLKRKGNNKPTKKQLETERNVTGLKLLSYMIDKKSKQKMEIGFRTYRGKTGKTSKTSNTMQYSSALQNCFAEKNK